MKRSITGPLPLRFLPLGQPEPWSTKKRDTELREPSWGTTERAVHSPPSSVCLTMKVISEGFSVCRSAPAAKGSTW